MMEAEARVVQLQASAAPRLPATSGSQGENLGSAQHLGEDGDLLTPWFRTASLQNMREYISALSNTKAVVFVGAQPWGHKLSVYPSIYSKETSLRSETGCVTFGA